MKKKINDAIMKKHINVEQVGFIDNDGKKELQMAGGEFCGNATRSAVYSYLGGKEGNMQIYVNSKDKIIAGVNKNQKAWCEIPIYNDRNVVTKKEEGIYSVRLKGITMLVIQDPVSKMYLKKRSNLKQIGKELIDKFGIENDTAVGVMFCEKEKDKMKINPIVWVKEIDTLFYETACGSGSTAVGMLEAYLKNKSQTIDILQPSGLTITVKVNYDNEFQKAIILGDVENDGKIYTLDINDKR